MRLSPNDLFLLNQCAISAACQAGQLIARYAQQRVAVNTKDGGSSLAAQVVTEVDHLSQDTILSILHPTCAHFDLAVLSEERPDDHERLRKDFFWCIDPLDGTLAFIEAVPGYSVSIALVSRAGIPIMGVVYDPVTQTLYHALKGQGAWRNQRALQVAAPAVTNQLLTFITDKSFAQDSRYARTQAELKGIAHALGYSDATLQLQGGAAMNACKVLDSPHACYFKFPKPQRGGGSVWDYAATACIFQEVAAPVSDSLGYPLLLNPEGQTFMNHCGVLYASNQAIAARMTQLYSQIAR